ETAPAIRERYRQQASLCQTDYLLKLLDINNRCDLNYKISNNKRLHLELAVMQMCQLAGQATVQPSPSIIPPAVPKSIPKEKKPDAAPAATGPEVPVKPKEGKSYGGTISIKGAKEQKDKQEDPSASLAEQPAEAYRPAAVFSQEELEAAWDQFSETLQKGSPHLYSTLKKYRPVLKEEFVIEFCTDNKLLEEELNRKKPELLEHLWKTLNNYRITMQTVIAAIPRGNKPYTNREKFDRMAEKNPSLLDLREKLDLDVE
ncbi:MAG TPA: hypothetical protein VMC08_03610, partial [Bacteroidales bacterium]|nr:hypothetical protein [Bacteroidales bacterium]